MLSYVFELDANIAHFVYYGKTLLNNKILFDLVQPKDLAHCSWKVERKFVCSQQHLVRSKELVLCAKISVL